MKKLLMFTSKRPFNLTKSALVPSMALALAVGFWTASAPVVKAQDEIFNKNDKGTGKGGKGPGKGGGVGKCDVCHNPHNYHTISIPCDQVDKFLSNHPGDFRGPCQVTGVQNP
jgi:hypothetical protein